MIFSTQCSKCGGGTNQLYACNCAVTATMKRKLDECNTVDEVLAWFAEYKRPIEAMHRCYQIGFSDGMNE